jgi:hypothetical protein
MIPTKKYKRIQHDTHRRFPPNTITQPAPPPNNKGKGGKHRPKRSRRKPGKGTRYDKIRLDLMSYVPERIVRHSDTVTWTDFDKLMNERKSMR